MSDITERKRIEEALQESEKKYRNFVERANDGVCIIQDGLVKYANSRQVEMWGGIIEEIIDTPFVNYVHPDDLSWVIERYNRRMAGEQVPSVYEAALRRKDGSKAYAELNVGTINYSGEPAELVITRDITERKQMEEELRESEEKYRSLVNEINDGIFIVDGRGSIVFANKALADIHGFKGSEELVGKNFIEYIAPEARDEVTKDFRGQVKTTKLPEAIDVPIIREDGNIAFVQVKPVPIIKEGRVVGVRGVVRDVTRRRRMED